jgi:hypothetical protein
MKVIKEGKVKLGKDGNYTISGFDIDCDGESMDWEQFIKITLQRMDKE